MTEIRTVCQYAGRVRDRRSQVLYEAVTGGVRGGGEVRLRVTRDFESAQEGKNDRKK
jgi:hypothetical protein